MALFGGACFADRRAAFGVPLAAMALSDLAIGLLTGNLSMGLHALLPVVYGSFALIVCLGFWLRTRRRVAPIVGAVLASSVLFFILSNLGAWAVFYPKTWEGLVACYVAAIPFFHHTLLGDAVFSAAFGWLAFAEKAFPALHEAALLRPAGMP